MGLRFHSWEVAVATANRLAYYSGRRFTVRLDGTRWRVQEVGA